MRKGDGAPPRCKRRGFRACIHYDSDYELKPGASLSNQFNFYDATRTNFMEDTGSFDSCLVYTEGRYFNG